MSRHLWKYGHPFYRCSRCGLEKVGGSRVGGPCLPQPAVEREKTGRHAHVPAATHPWRSDYKEQAAERLKLRRAKYRGYYREHREEGRLRSMKHYIRRHYRCGRADVDVEHVPMPALKTAKGECPCSCGGTWAREVSRPGGPA